MPFNIKIGVGTPKGLPVPQVVFRKINLYYYGFVLIARIFMDK